MLQRSLFPSGYGDPKRERAVAVMQPADLIIYQVLTRTVPTLGLERPW